MNNDQFSLAYAMIDAFARKFAGVAVPAHYSKPTWILTKSNIPANPGVTIQTLPDDSAVYKALWGKS